VPPFVVTLGGMSAFRGAALLLPPAPDQRLRAVPRVVGQGKTGPLPILGWQIPIPVIIFLVFAVLAHIVLRYTRYGRQVYAVGGNPEAARLSGLDVRAVVTSVSSSWASSPASALSCWRRG